MQGDQIKMGNVYYMITPTESDESRELGSSGNELFLLTSDPDSYDPWVNVVVENKEENCFVFLPACFVSGEEYEGEEYEC